jgi:hypothetical protein
MTTTDAMPRVVPAPATRTEFMLQASVRAVENQMRVVRPLILRLSVERSFAPCCRLLAEIYGYEEITSEVVSDKCVRTLFARSLQAQELPESVRVAKATPGSVD